MSGVQRVPPLPILVVDDDPLVRTTLARLLGDEGHEVTVASCCTDARKLDGPFAVAVLDLDLGDGWGTELARSLLDRGVARQVVFFSGLGDGDIIEDARKLGPVFGKGTFEGFHALVASLGVPEVVEADAG